MKLYFFRHGIAADAEPDQPDANRQLTNKGKTRTRKAARLLAETGVKPERIYSSPLVRARQTAELLSEALDVVVQVKKEVGPGFDRAAVEKLIADLDDETDIMFVGHEPDFSTVIGDLIGGGDVTVKKGSLARIDIVTREPLRGSLVWLLPPKLLANEDLLPTDDDSDSSSLPDSPLGRPVRPPLGRLPGAKPLRPPFAPQDGDDDAGSDDDNPFS